MARLLDKLLGKSSQQGAADYYSPLREFGAGHVDISEQVAHPSRVLGTHTAANTALSATLTLDNDLIAGATGASGAYTITLAKQTTRPKLNGLGTGLDFATNSTTVANSDTDGTTGKGALDLVPGQRIITALGNVFTVTAVASKDSLTVDHRPGTAETDQTNVYFLDDVPDKLTQADVGRVITGQGIAVNTVVLKVSDDGRTITVSKALSGAVSGFIKLSRVFYITKLIFGYSAYFLPSTTDFTLSRYDGNAQITIGNFPLGVMFDTTGESIITGDGMRCLDFSNDPIRVDFPGQTIKFEGPTSASASINGTVQAHGYTLAK